MVFPFELTLKRFSLNVQERTLFRTNLFHETG